MGLKQQMMMGFSILLGLGLVGYALLCLGLRQWQTRLIFKPDPVLEATPSVVGLDYDEFWLDVGQRGTAGSVHGWWIPAAGEGDRHSSPVVLYLHGNGSNLGDGVGMAQQFHALGWTSVLIDYRGYGRSVGPFPNEQRAYEDAEAAWRYLVVERHIDPQQIMVYGHSLGGAIAIELATRHPTMAGLIIEGSFTSMRAMAEHIGRYRVLPLDWVLTQQFDSITKVRSLAVPMLFLHGTADQTIPAVMSQALYDATPAPKSVVLIDGASHTNLPEVGGEPYREALLTFAAAHVGARGSRHDYSTP